MSADPILHSEFIKKEYPIGTKVVFIEISYSGLNYSGVLRPQSVHTHYSLDMVGIGLVALSYKAFFVRNSPVELLREGSPFSIYCKIEDLKEAAVWLMNCWDLKVKKDTKHAFDLLAKIDQYKCNESIVAGKKYDVFVDNKKVAVNVNQTSAWLKLAEYGTDLFDTSFYVTYHDKREIAEHFTPF